MFKINTPDGEKYLVQLVGAASYRIGGLYVTRGKTLTVSRRTRDYLVMKTKGQFVDYDPTPAVPVHEYFPPQFGRPQTAEFDMGDFDPVKNPPLSQAEAAMLAEQSRDGSVEVDPASVAGTAPMVTSDAESGDLTSADLPKAGAIRKGKKSPVVLKSPPGEASGFTGAAGGSDGGDGAILVE